MTGAFERLPNYYCHYYYYYIVIYYFIFRERNMGALLIVFYQ